MPLWFYITFYVMSITFIAIVGKKKVLHSSAETWRSSAEALLLKVELLEDDIRALKEQNAEQQEMIDELRSENATLRGADPDAGLVDKRPPARASRGRRRNGPTDPPLPSYWRV